MNPIDFRNETFTSLQGRLIAKRIDVLMDWVRYEDGMQRAGLGVGATTREVCERYGRDILQFRPRCTELYQMGVLALVEENTHTPAPASPNRKSQIANRKSREGLYRLRSLEEWEGWVTEQREHAISAQQQLL